jgi:hypothetical protein
MNKIRTVIKKNLTANNTTTIPSGLPTAIAGAMKTTSNGAAIFTTIPSRSTTIPSQLTLKSVLKRAVLESDRQPTKKELTVLRDDGEAVDEAGVKAEAKAAAIAMAINIASGGSMKIDRKKIANRKPIITLTNRRLTTKRRPGKRPPDQPVEANRVLTTMIDRKNAAAVEDGGAGAGVIAPSSGRLTIGRNLTDRRRRTFHSLK